MIHEDNVEFRLECDELGWITVTNKRSGAIARLTIAGDDIIVGDANGKLVGDIKGADVKRIGG